MLLQSIKILGVSAVLVVLGQAQSQTPPSVYDVLLWSTVKSQTVGGVTLQQAVPTIFSQQKVSTNFNDPNFGNVITSPGNYGIGQSIIQVGGAVNASIATALSVIPLASPVSGVISKTDPATGAQLPVSSTLGTVFTERAETIGKHKFWVGVSYQDFHFSKLNGTSLNNLQMLIPGGVSSNISGSAGAQPFTTAPATFNVGLDVRLSQNIAYLTYGITNRFDISVGLPVVHSSVSARTYNGQVYSGAGDGVSGNCWCVNTFTPGSPNLITPEIGSASLSKTGFGDLLIRAKGTLIAKGSAAVAIGADLRLPTGDEKNYLGTGATAVKPFIAASLYTKEFSNGLVFSPHLNIGWQFSGKSILGGSLQGTPQTVKFADGSTFNYVGAPFITNKDYLPDVFTWAAGTEIALGRHATVVADILGNQIGWVHGIANTATLSIPNQPSPVAPFNKMNATGLVRGGPTSFGQYSGALGFKTRVAGKLVFTFNTLIRLDDNGLVARFVPLYGLGYTF